MTRGRRREHYQWNMDILGVAGVEVKSPAPSSLPTLPSPLPPPALCPLPSLLLFLFHRLLVICPSLPPSPRQTEAEAELLAAIVMFFSRLGLSAADVGIRVSSRKVLQAVLEKHHIPPLSFAPVCVVVDKAFDKEGQLRAICGGGRYDRLLSTFGGTDTPAVGFGFGDAVIVELLKDRGLLPELSHVVDDVVIALDASLRPQAAAIATRLRSSGRVVDLLRGGAGDVHIRRAFKQAERLSAGRMVMLGVSEWERGVVRVKDLKKREESDVPFADLM
eukprot:jgi/Mesen1/599/ME001074S10757